MKIIDGAWEKCNFGITSEELTLSDKDGTDDLDNGLNQLRAQAGYKKQDSVKVFAKHLYIVS